MKMVQSLNDPFAMEMSAQREYAEAADEKYELLARHQALARRARPALELRLIKAAKNKYQLHLVKLALQHLPLNIRVRIDRRRLSGAAGRSRGAESGITLARVPTTLDGLDIFLHEVAHIELRHFDDFVSVDVQSPYANDDEVRTWVPQHEVEAEGRAQKIMRSHGLKIPREQRGYLIVARSAALQQKAEQKRERADLKRTIMQICEAS